MTLSPERWNELTPSQYPWEREAQQWLRDSLPDQEPWHVWTNCEFLAASGAIYEVDAVVLSPVGLWLIEFKSHSGKLRSEDGLWILEHGGRRRAIENPVFLANRKAKALKGALQAAAGGRHGDIPWVAPLVILAGSGVELGLAGAEVAHVAMPDHKNAVEKGRISGAVKALSTGQVLGVDPRTVTPVGKSQITIVHRAMGAVMRSTTARTRVGDYRLDRLLGEGVGYQDWLGTHQSLKNTRRRIRWYLVRDQATPDERSRIQRAAEREAGILQGIRDPAILAFRELISADRGPALTFDYHPDAVTLDHWLAQRTGGLDVYAAFELLEQLTNAVRQAHAHHLVHRALSPSSVLVLPKSDDPKQIPDIALANWQTALALTGEHKTSGTVHVEELLDSRAAAYCAPEALKSPELADGRADVFSLGCLAWLLFTGKAPGASHLDIDRQLRAQGSLRLVGAVDGCPPGLDELIANATRADLRHRSQIDNLADDLEELFAGLVGERPERPAADVLAAIPGEQLVDESTRQIFTVERRLGAGASAVAYRVKDRAGTIAVLKVARSAEHDPTLRAEFEVLGKLRDGHIVRARALCTMSGRVAILMDDAGECLAARLRSDGPLHYDMLWRLGEDLLCAVDHLESEGVFHRDIKPDNMAIGEARGSRKQTLVLFDFSLARTDLARLAVGTRQYLDPFLGDRRVPRYDTAAERYAAALSLYEMATARLPAWGDGLGDPRFDRDAQLTLATDRFPANIREPLADFFLRALDRESERRFGNARDMLHAWTRIFAEAAKASTSGHGSTVDEAELTLDSPVSAIGLSPSSANVLDRLDVTTVRALLQLRLGDLRGTKGITHRTKIEIRDAKQRLAERFPGIPEQDLPSMPAGGVTALSAEAGPLGELSIDYCLDRLLHDDADDARGQSYTRALLGLGDVAAETAAIWPSQGAVATQFQVTRQAVGQHWGKRCGRWKTKSGTVTALRQAVLAILKLQGGAMTAIELADALLAQRGCREQDLAARRRKALAVLKPALDVEADFQDPEFVFARCAHTVVVATDAGLIAYAERLGEAADALVADLPPASPAKALERLRAVAPAGEVPLDDRRLLALAAAASGRASFSPNRMELYPRAMPALWALKLASGALITGPGVVISVRDLHQRVRDRYPDAELLPDQPELDRLVEDAGLGIRYDANAVYDRELGLTGGYTSPATSGFPGTTASHLFSSRSNHAPRPIRDEDRESAEACQSRLQASRANRGYLVIQCKAEHALPAAAALRQAFPELVEVDCDAELLAGMRAHAQRTRIDWDRVLAADAARPGTREFLNLRRLVGEAAQQLLPRLVGSAAPLLLTNPGMLARYDQIALLDALRDAAGTPSGPPGAWVLLPVGSFGAHPAIDGVAVPIIGSNQTMHLDRHWIAQHRASQGAA